MQTGGDPAQAEVDHVSSGVGAGSSRCSRVGGGRPKSVLLLATSGRVLPRRRRWTGGRSHIDATIRCDPAQAGIDQAARHLASEVLSTSAQAEIDRIPTPWKNELGRYSLE